jgi:hypothetical protein
LAETAQLPINRSIFAFSFLYMVQSRRSTGMKDTCNTGVKWGIDGIYYNVGTEYLKAAMLLGMNCRQDLKSHIPPAKPEA